MRSGELAALAGVTVRTLRHYHQLGILDEPERAANGYREYDVHDLVRVLRIRRLADLGLGLEAIPGVLDDTGDGHAVVLEQLDTELAAQVARLEEQRAVIAALRRDGASPDLPPELARQWHALVEAGQPRRLAELDRDQILILVQLGGARAVSMVARLYAQVEDPGQRAAYLELGARFERLTSETATAEVDRLVADTTSFLGRMVADLGDEELDLDAGEALLDAHSRDLLNPTQRAVLGRIQAALAR
ncbi:MerR family transcriptional regulator [Nocardioides lianchengensis]|uniref:DNA-binding transcriptional regulator, MerR family n=1 Tax=Nocardioides lianchengensis TaxID=1045774 RepID=A0A1G6NRS8_9ACTN|nr:MerR family transcriptional regulator [Nocardioides lianchengensis]NYG10864.1 DNA-binding transcriptional MerR regulator [Nocardioides lianchengensis]SDC70479.1 DNA-binding transcriptional regulator, MerR family [Nocardioides lianchengensis]